MSSWSTSLSWSSYASTVNELPQTRSAHFMHEITPLRGNRSAKAAACPTTQPTQSSDDQADPEACRNFQAGNCRYGEDCPYAHTGGLPKRPAAAAAPAKATPAVLTPSPCHHEAVKQGTCPRKGSCRFSHNRARVAHKHKDKAKSAAHAERIKAYNTRVAKAAIPDSTTT